MVRSVCAGVPLAPLTTLGVGGPAARMVTVTSGADLAEAVLAADAPSEPLLVLGGGSNLLVSDAGFPGTVVLVRSRGVALEDRGASSLLRVAAGEVWDDVVALSLSEGLAGLEALSGIPGSAGATPVQNVGAYGAEVSSSLVSLTVLDRHSRSVRSLPAFECGFSYRTSVLRSSRYVVLELVLELVRSPSSAPVRYPELASVLGVDLGATAPAARVREAVLSLRRSKGMVLDPSDPDSRSAGSFFKNPVIDPPLADHLPKDAPRWPLPGGGVKTSAARLLELSGFTRGSGRGPVGLSTKHSLAVVNRGGASASDVALFARTVRSRVLEVTGVLLEVEPVLVGLEL